MSRRSSRTMPAGTRLSIQSGKCSRLFLGRVWKLDVEPAPRLIIDQAPAMTGAGRISGQQHVSRVQDECFTVARGELERARQGDDVLQARRGVPVEGRPGSGLLEMHGR